jgi:hypothetical protein
VGNQLLQPPVLVLEVLQPLGFLALHPANDHRFAAVPGPPPRRHQIAHLKGLETLGSRSVVWVDQSPQHIR